WREAAGRLSFGDMLADVCHFLALSSQENALKYFAFWSTILGLRQAPATKRDQALTAASFVRDKSGSCSSFCFLARRLLSISESLVCESSALNGLRMKPSATS